MKVEVSYRPSTQTVDWHLTEERRVDIEHELISEYQLDKEDVFNASDRELLVWYREVKQWEVNAA